MWIWEVARDTCIRTLPHTILVRSLVLDPNPSPCRRAHRAPCFAAPWQWGAQHGCSEPCHGPVVSYGPSVTGCDAPWLWEVGLQDEDVAAVLWLSQSEEQERCEGFGCAIPPPSWSALATLAVSRK